MRPNSLASPLARAIDVRAASWVVVEHLAGPQLRPSVYVERGGRLRCQALLGYRQLLDGLPPWAGVIGRAYATGEPSVVEEVESDRHYLSVAGGVVAEACFPVTCWGRTVGAVNLEAPRPFADGEVERVRIAAIMFGARIEALGGPAPESASQRLVRHAIALANQYDVDGIERAVVAAAVDITPLTSAMLLCRTAAPDPFTPCQTHGPLEAVLSGASPGAIAALAGFVRAGCSMYTVSDDGPEAGAGGNSGLEALRAAGATSLAALAAGPDRLLVVAGDTSVGLETEHCELLELLAAQASACLRNAESVSALRTQASTDALTGLGHHATFHTELAEARDAGDVGVLVIDIDAFKEYNDRHGHPGGDRALRVTAGVLTEALRRGDSLFRIGGDEFAALLPGVDGASALEVARRLHEAVTGSPTGLSVSIGAAAAVAGEDETRVLARADRALYAVKERGRDGVALDDDPMVEPARTG